MISFQIITKMHIILQLGPWMAVEIPDLIKRGVVVHKDDQPVEETK